MRALKASTRTTQPAETTAELGMLVLVLMVVFAGFAAIAVEVQAQLELVAVAEETAHSAALAATADESVARGVARGQEVGQGYHLRNGSLNVRVDASDFGPPGRVQATVRYRLTRQDIPLLLGTEVDLMQTHAEPVAPYRSTGAP
jgi:hypothetical protein